MALEVISATDLFELTHPDTHDQLVSLAEGEGTDALVVFERLDLGMLLKDGPVLKVLAVGPSRTYSLGDCQKEGTHLGEVPSQFLYPTKVCPAHLLGRDVTGYGK
jgi:hypothetical protein